MSTDKPSSNKYTTTLNRYPVYETTRGNYLDFGLGGVRKVALSAAAAAFELGLPIHEQTRDYLIANPEIAKELGSGALLSIQPPGTTIKVEKCPVASDFPNDEGPLPYQNGHRTHNGLAANKDNWDGHLHGEPLRVPRIVHQ